MEPEMQKRQFQLLVPTIICIAFLGLLKAFDTRLPFWLGLSLYVILTVICIGNVVRVIRLNKQNRG